LFAKGGTDIYQPNESAARPDTSSSSMRPIVFILIQVINLYMYLLIASAIFSWLIAFNVVNTRNQFVAAIAEFLYRITEPVLGPIRRRLPNFGGLDISPIIAFFVLWLIQLYLVEYVYPYVP
jgi:YggT family protein